MNSMLKNFCMMTHALHGWNCFFTADHTPPHTDYYPLCVALARAWRWCTRWPIDKLVTREKKMVSTTSLLRCTTAQRSNMLPSTHNRRWPCFEGPAVLKMDADKKMMDFTVAEACQTSLQPQRYTHHALRTARLGGTCNKSTTLIIRWGTNVQPNFTIVA